LRVDSISRDIGPSHDTVRNHENDAAPNTQPISCATAQIPRHEEPILFRLNVDHVVNERRAALLGQARGQRIAKFSASTPADQDDIDAGDLLNRNLAGTFDAGRPRETSSFGVCRIRAHAFPEPRRSKRDCTAI
jgi:hypothetical protein